MRPSVTTSQAPAASPLAGHRPNAFWPVHLDGEQRCICPGGVACDHVTGRCGCPAGYTGNSCETMGPQGMFGLICSQMCTCSGDPYSRQHVTGKCTCLPACPRGRYGTHCQSFCTCAEGGMCDPVNGSCTVDVGWAGPGNTVKKVVTGRFGRAYAELCECDETPCDPATGLCLCPPGKTGKHCEKVCDSRSYGPGCSFECQCAHGGQCDRRTGHCSCPLTWLGPTCEEGVYVNHVSSKLQKRSVSHS